MPARHWFPQLDISVLSDDQLSNLAKQWEAIDEQRETLILLEREHFRDAMAGDTDALRTLAEVRVCNAAMGLQLRAIVAQMCAHFGVTIDPNAWNLFS